MHAKHLAFLLATIGVLWAPKALAATIAVMPVEGVNLSEGQCDAIGVLFTSAVSRDANVAVASPLETKALRRQLPTAAAVAARLGAEFYVELTAIQLGVKVKLAGAVFNKDGTLIYRAQTLAPSLDGMDVETARLARALVLRQPVPPAYPSVTAEPAAPIEVPAPAEVDSATESYPKALGAKVGLAVPFASGRSFSPMMGGQFDGRVGTREYFFEFGAGAYLTANTGVSNDTTTLRAELFFVELGGSYYLSEGNPGIYVGGGIMPTLWSSRLAYETKESVTLGLYGQLGVTLTRDSRFRLYGEARVSQYCLPVIDPAVDSSGYGTGSSGTYYPTLIALQVGVGW